MNLIKQAILIVALLAALGLTACGGGGGGGGGNDGPIGGDSDKGIRVIHGSLDAAPVDIISSTDPEQILQISRFAIPIGYSRLRSAPQVVTAFRTQSRTQTLFVADLDVDNDDRYSLIFYGDTTRFGLRSNLVLDEPPQDLAAGMAALRIIHTVIGAAELNATFAGVDIASGVDFGAASSYVTVPAGSGALSIERAVDFKNIFSASRTLAPGEIVTILVTGEVDYLVLAPVYPG